MDIITLLKSTKVETQEFFNLPASQLTKSYAQGKWTIQQILIHLADCESVLHERIKRAIAEPHPTVFKFDQDAWCEQLAYESFPLPLSEAIYTAHRNAVIYLAEKFYVSTGEKTFTHSQLGTRTVKEEFDKIAHHNDAHLQQIHKALS